MLCKVSTLIICLGCVWVPPILAYVPTIGELFEWIEQRPHRFKSLYMETHTEVFTPNYAPEALLQATSNGENNFVQRIYWRSGRQLAIETLSGDGKKVLHVYLQQGKRIRAATLGERPFVLADIRPPFLGFMQHSGAAWRAELSAWGVFPTEVRLAPHLKSTHVLKLWQHQESALWLDETTFAPILLQTQIHGDKEEPWRLSIYFGPFIMANKRSVHMRYPLQIDFLIEQRLFRRTKVVRFIPGARPNRGLVKRIRRQIQQFPAQQLQRLRSAYVP